MTASVDPKILGVAIKTVAIFSSIVSKPLQLVNDKRPHTKGDKLHVPFNSPRMYTHVERQLAHVLFRSDAGARTKFVRSFVSKVSEIVRNKAKDPEVIAIVEEVMERVIDVLESHRIESLWGDIYPGSYDAMRLQIRRDTLYLKKEAHNYFFNMLICLDGGHDPLPGDLDRFRPYFVEALQRVEHRGFTATLVLARWLVTHLINEMLREDRGKSAAVPGTTLPVLAETLSKGQKGMPSVSSSEGSPEDPSQEMPWHPPPEKATAEERLAMLGALAKQFGAIDKRIEDRYSDYGGSESLDRKSSILALSLDMQNAEAVDKLLEESAEEMTEFLESVQRALKPTMKRDDILKRDGNQHVDFIDVRKEDAIFEEDPEARNLEDRNAARRLRGFFYSIRGKRASALEMSGVEIDPQAFIERKLSGGDVPCFRQNASGRGFRIIVLVDRSSSMEGVRSEQAERGVGILTEALKFPFVRLDTWGFQQMGNATRVVRYERGVTMLDSVKSPVDGSTPLSTAVNLARRELEDGADLKHLVILTDGEPTHTGMSSHSRSKNLYDEVRTEVVAARCRGIAVTTLLLGEALDNGKVVFGVDANRLEIMFGNPRHWSCVDGDNFAEDLVRVVSKSFMTYLKHG